MRRKSSSECGPDCRYRLLYEGSQSSLNDMAAKQTAALQRITTLRAGVIQLMKQHFAREHANSEKQRGHKIGSAHDQDAVLMALLDGYIRGLIMRGEAHTHPDLEELRQALSGLGVGVAPGSDVRAMTLAVRATQSLLREPAPVPPTNEPVAAAVMPAAGNAAVTGGSEVVADGAGDGSDFDPGMDVVWETDADHGLLAAFDDVPGEIPPPVSQDPQWDLSDLFDAPEDGGETTGALTGEELLASLAPQEVAPPVARKDAPAPALPDLPTAKPSPGPEVAAPVVAPAVDKVRTASDTLRPQMFPQVAKPKKARGTKQARVSATPPAPKEPAAAQVPVEGAEATFEQLYEKVAQNTPVFMSDLVNEVADPGVVRAWAETFEDLGTAAPVRVITPRSHHQKRGNLVIPYSPELREKFSSQERTAWSECLDSGKKGRRLRGAVLYEVGVLLHRFQKDIVSFNRNGSVLSMRVKSHQGVMGIVMWLSRDGQLQGKPREELSKAVAEMVGERLEVLAVLTHETGTRAVERLAAAVSDDAAAQGWAPAMPVIACRSWEFAMDSKASAVSIL